MTDVEIEKGELKSFDIRLINPATSEDMTGVFVESDAVSATIHAGGDTPILVQPAAAWVSGSNQSKVRVTITPTNTQNLAATTYTLRVLVTPSDGHRRVVAKLGLRVEMPPGTTALEPVYVTVNDMKIFYDAIETLQTPGQVEGFRAQRGFARRKFDGMILNAYRRNGGGHIQYLSPLNAARRNMDWGDCGTADAPRDEAMKGWLAANRLVLNEDVIKINACWSLALIFQSLPSANPEDPVGHYGRLARNYNQMAQASIHNCVAEIDTKAVADGKGDLTVRIGEIGVIFR